MTDCRYPHICMACGANNHLTCGCGEKVEHRHKKAATERKERQAACAHVWQPLISGANGSVLGRDCLTCYLFEDL